VEFSTTERVNEIYCVNGTFFNGLLYGKSYLSYSESVTQIAITIPCEDTTSKFDCYMPVALAKSRNIF